MYVVIIIEIIDPEHRFAPVQERIGEMEADEACRTGDEQWTGHAGTLEREVIESPRPMPR